MAFNVGQGPVLWTPQGQQDGLFVDVTFLNDEQDYYAVVDPFVSTGGFAPGWCSGVCQFFFDAAGSGPGPISVTAPTTNGQGVSCGSGHYRRLGGAQTTLAVQISNGLFFFRHDNGTAEQFGEAFTVADGDYLGFCFRYPITAPTGG